MTGLNDGETYEQESLTITALKSKHESFDKTAKGEYPYLGYIIQSGNLCLYHSGDTLLYEGMLTYLQSFDFTVTFLPINGRDAARFRAGCLGNMTFQEAVDLAGELKPKLVVPIHYDMFAGNCEDPHNFEDYLNIKYPGVDCWIGQPGTMVEV